MKSITERLSEHQALLAKGLYPVTQQGVEKLAILLDETVKYIKQIEEEKTELGWMIDGLRK